MQGMHDTNQGDDIVQDTDTEIEDRDVVLEDDETPITAKLKALRDQLKEVQKERDNNLAGWQRAKADLVNFKRETAEANESRSKYATKQVLLDLLPVLDSFDMAIASPAWQSTDPTWRKGMEGVYAQALTAAKTHGLEQYTPQEGEEFSPEKHEAVGVEKTVNGAGDHTIAKVLQKGYTLHQTIIRPATVIIYTNE